MLLPLTVAVYCEDFPRVTVVAPLSATETTSPEPLPPEVCGAVKVTDMLSDAEESATLVAVMLTLPPWGDVAGAVYRPVGEISPRVELPPVTPLTLQLTEVLLVPVTVATYGAEVPSVTLVGPASFKATDEVSAGGCGAARATERLFATEGLATLVAVIVTEED